MKTVLALLLVGSVLASVPLENSPRVLAQSPLSTQVLNLETTHPNGVTLQVSDVRFTKTTISLNMAATNRSTRKIQLNRSTKEMVLVDNLGNRYFLEPPTTNKYLLMNPGKVSQGWLSFRGGLAPKATSLTLITNSRMGLKTDPATQYPLITMQIPVKQNVVRGQTAPPQLDRGTRASNGFVWATPPSFTIQGRRVAVPRGNFVIQSPNGARLRIKAPNVNSSTTGQINTGSARTASLQASSPNQTGTRPQSIAAPQSALTYSEQGLKVQHPNGTVLQVMGVRFGSDRIFVSVNVVNRSPRTIKLNSNPRDLVLMDNLGNQYDIMTATDNPRVEVPPYGIFRDELVFATPLDSKATALTLITNQRSGRGLQRASTAPQFIVALPMKQ